MVLDTFRLVLDLRRLGAHDSSFDRPARRQQFFVGLRLELRYGLGDQRVCDGGSPLEGLAPLFVLNAQ